MNLMAYRTTAIATFVLGGFFIGFGYTYLQPVALAQARNLERSADALAATDPKGAIIKYRYAHMLAPSDALITHKLAAGYLTAGELDDAIRAYLSLPGEKGRAQAASLLLRQHQPARARDILSTALEEKASSELYAVQANALSELGDGEGAANAARREISYGLGDEAASLHLIIIYLAHDKAEAAAVAASLTSVEARSAAQSWGVSKTALAQELYARGLPVSSQRVLMRGNGPENAQEVSLLAVIKLETAKRQPELEAVKHLLKSGVERYPANMKLHEQLKSVYEELGDEAGAAAEAKIIERLKHGAI